MDLINLKKVFLALALLLFSNGLFAQQNNEYLETLIQEAIVKSPKIKEYNSKLNVFTARTQIGTNLPDPTLTLGLMNLPTNSFAFDQEPMTGKIIGLSQGIPFPGALGAKEDVKAADTAIVRQEINDLKNKIREEVSSKYFSLQLVREKISLANKSLELLEQISDVAKSKYEVNKASLHNVIQVEVQITRVKDKIEKLLGAEKSIVAELNAILLRNEEEAVLTERILEINAAKLNQKELIDASKNSRPLLKGIKEAITKADLMSEAAKYEFYPNFKFGVQYSQRDEIAKTSTNLNDFLSFVVGVSLPINYGGKKTAKVNEARFLKSQYLEKYNASIQTLEQSFGNILSKLNELENREQLISSTLLPQAEQLLKASLADYQVAKIDFINVIKAENDILNIENELAEVRAEYYKNLAKLEFLSGERYINKF